MFLNGNGCNCCQQGAICASQFNTGSRVPAHNHFSMMVGRSQIQSTSQFVGCSCGSDMHLENQPILRISIAKPTFISEDI